MVSEVFAVVKDAALVILISLTLGKIIEGGDDKWYRLIFLFLLLTL